MNTQTLPENQTFSRSTLAMLIAVSLGLVLLSALLPIPRPLAVSSQPWKVEFLASIFVILLGVWIYRAKCTQYGADAFHDKRVLALAAFGSAFVAWSGLSVLWAYSPLSAIHHSLEWAIYLSILVATLFLIRQSNGYSIVLKSFVLVAGVLGLLCVMDYVTLIDFSIAEGHIRIRYGKFAELLVTIAPVLCIFTLYLRKRRGWLALLIVWLLSWLTVMLSLSKGAFLAGIAGHAVLFIGCIFLSDRHIRRRAAFLAGVWLAATISTQVLFSMASAIPSTTDYISGSADQSRGTTQMRVFTWRVALSMATNHLVTGVGADNFGVAFNDGRAAMNRNKAGSGAEVAEDYVVERAHNEFLQIFAELGIVGLGLLTGASAAFASLVLAAFRRNRYRLSPVLWAALAGMTAFFASSAVSSFSFRVVQNGIVFFMLLALAITESLKICGGDRPVQELLPKLPRRLMAVGAAAAVLMIAYCGAKAFGEYYVYTAERTQQYETSAEFYQQALRFDPDNAAAYNFLASRYAGANNYQNAAGALRIGIDRGIGVTVTYSYLAKYQALAGDDAAAQRTFDEALKMFPNSVFMRVRYATYLADRGREAESAGQMEIAKGIDKRQAAGWLSLIRDGSVATFYKAQTDTQIAPPADLLPGNAVPEYVDRQDFSVEGQQ